MTDVRRSILWVVFLGSIMMLWDAWSVHRGGVSMFAPPQASVATAPAAASGIQPNAASAAVPAPTATPLTNGVAQGSALPAAPGATPAPQGELVTVTTDVARVTFDALGASVVKLELLKHLQTHEGKEAPGHKPQPVVLFDRSATHTYVAQSGLVQAGASAPNHQTAMRVLPGVRTLAPGQDSLKVIFEGEEGGVALTKTFTLKRGDPVIDVQHSVSNRSAQAVSPQLYVQLVRDASAAASSMPNFFAAPQSFSGPAIYTEQGKYQKLEFAKIGTPELEMQKSADNGWVAMVQHYFVSAWLNPVAAAPQSREFFARKLDGNLYAAGMLFPAVTLAPGQTQVFSQRLLAGPQEEKKLETLAPGLVLVKDYGVFAIFAKPLFWLLDLIHGVIGNWGWAIVALVVLLKAAFYSLNASAYRSMAKMKVLAPKVTALREQYKDRPQEMQQQMVKIYRDEKVNPLGGCLPILIQIPVFIALYWVLSSSVEMRGAPWMGWITDLSVKDPWFVLPALMTLTSLLQTWLNPAPADPLQAKLMWIMPLLFSVMFFVFPAGLVLYWLTNNILSIAQQWMINRQLGT